MTGSAGAAGASRTQMDEFESVVAVAEGVDANVRCITVFVNNPTAGLRIPSSLGQHPVVVRETDSIRARD